MHRYDFHENDDSIYLYDEDFEDELDPGISDMDEGEIKGLTKGGEARSRRSVDEYLEKKKLRQRYKDLFDDYFGENS